MITYLDYWKQVQGYRIRSKSTRRRIGRDEFYRANLDNQRRIDQLLNGTHLFYELVKEGRLK